MACWSCNKVKGKRECPASPASALGSSADGRGTICSKCCGTKRRVVIDCPSDCLYLHGEHDPRWESQEQQSEQTRFMGRLRETKAEHLPFLVFLHHVLLQAGPATRDMGDAALLHVAETTLRNLETRASGILYDHQVERADLQPLVEWMTELILQRSKVQLAPKLDDAGATHVLETVVEAIRGHAGGEEPKQYLDVAARVFAPLLAQAPSLELPPPPKPSAGLILPP